MIIQYKHREETLRDGKVDASLLLSPAISSKYGPYLPEDCRIALKSAAASSKDLADAADAYRQSVVNEPPTARVPAPHTMNRPGHEAPVLIEHPTSPPPEGSEAFPRTRGKSELYPIVKKDSADKINTVNPATTPSGQPNTHLTLPPANTGSPSIVAPQPKEPPRGGSWAKFERPTILGIQPPTTSNSTSNRSLDIRSNNRSDPPVSPRGGSRPALDTAGANYLTDTQEAFPGQHQPERPQLERKSSSGTLDLTSLLENLKTGDIAELITLSRSASSPKVAQLLQKCVELATKPPGL